MLLMLLLLILLLLSLHLRLPAPPKDASYVEKTGSTGIVSGLQNAWVKDMPGGGEAPKSAELVGSTLPAAKGLGTPISSEPEVTKRETG